MRACFGIAFETKTTKSKQKNKKKTNKTIQKVGGRYSVTSAVGMLPLSLHYSYEIMSEFLAGCRNIDEHFYENRKDLGKNIPALLGLLGIWNSTFLKYATRALIPYCEALLRLPAHIQQLDMESNGKRVNIENSKLIPFSAGEINFGEPGTNAQHSFFQLIHQGRVIPCDFIGFSKSQLVSDEKTFGKELRELIGMFVYSLEFFVFDAV